MNVRLNGAIAGVVCGNLKHPAVIIVVMAFGPGPGSAYASLSIHTLPGFWLIWAGSLLFLWCGLAKSSTKSENRLSATLACIQGSGARLSICGLLSIKVIVAMSFFASCLSRTVAVTHPVPRSHSLTHQVLVGTANQCSSALTQLRQYGTYIGSGWSKCAFALPGGKIVKIPSTAKCPKRACRNDSFPWQDSISKEIAALSLDPDWKPAPMFYCGKMARRTTLGQLSNAKRNARRRDRRCGGILQVNDSFFHSSIPFLVLQRVQTSPPCRDRIAALRSITAMADRFSRNESAMTVDFDHELAVLSSTCAFVYLDFDAFCYDSTANHIPVYSPFPLLSDRAPIRRCAGSLKAHVLRNWRKDIFKISQGFLPQSLSHR